MLKDSSPISKNNSFLASLSPEDAAELQQHLKLVDLKSAALLFEVGSRIKTVYFPVSGLISLSAPTLSETSVEVALVGWNGAVGTSSAVNETEATYRATVHLPGKAYSCSGREFREFASRPSVLRAVIRQEQMIYAQAQQSAACFGTHEVERRLARWLLRMSDLAGNAFPITQELIATCIGARRSTVTVAAQCLSQARVISHMRGRIEIIDTEGLKKMVCSCYDLEQSQVQRLSNPMDARGPAI